MHPDKGSKKKRSVALAGFVIVSTLLLPASILQAAEPSIGSRGKLEGMETVLKIYQQDINYLHHEKQQLLTECN